MPFLIRKQEHQLQPHPLRPSPIDFRVRLVLTKNSGKHNQEEFPPIYEEVPSYLKLESHFPPCYDNGGTATATDINPVNENSNVAELIRFIVEELFLTHHDGKEFLNNLRIYSESAADSPTSVTATRNNDLVLVYGNFQGNGNQIMQTHIKINDSFHSGQPSSRSTNANNKKRAKIGSHCKSRDHSNHAIHISLMEKVGIDSYAYVSSKENAYDILRSYSKIHERGISKADLILKAEYCPIVYGIKVLSKRKRDWERNSSRRTILCDVASKDGVFTMEYEIVPESIASEFGVREENDEKPEAKKKANIQQNQMAASVTLKRSRAVAAAQDSINTREETAEEAMDRKNSEAKSRKETERKKPTSSYPLNAPGVPPSLGLAWAEQTSTLTAAVAPRSSAKKMKRDAANLANNVKQPTESNDLQCKESTGRHLEVQVEKPGDTAGSLQLEQSGKRKQSDSDNDDDSDNTSINNGGAKEDLQASDSIDVAMYSKDEEEEDDASEKEHIEMIVDEVVVDGHIDKGKSGSDNGPVDKVEVDDENGSKGDTVDANTEKLKDSFSPNDAEMSPEDGDDVASEDSGDVANMDAVEDWKSRNVESGNVSRSGSSRGNKVEANIDGSIDGNKEHFTKIVDDKSKLMGSSKDSKTSGVLETNPKDEKAEANKHDIGSSKMVAAKEDKGNESESNSDDESSCSSSSDSSSIGSDTESSSDDDGDDDGKEVDDADAEIVVKKDKNVEENQNDAKDEGMQNFSESMNKRDINSTSKEKGSDDEDLEGNERDARSDSSDSSTTTTGSSSDSDSDSGSDSDSDSDSENGSDEDDVKNEKKVEVSSTVDIEARSGLVENIQDSRNSPDVAKKSLIVESTQERASENKESGLPQFSNNESIPTKESSHEDEKVLHAFDGGKSRLEESNYDFQLQSQDTKTSEGSKAKFPGPLKQSLGQLVDDSSLRSESSASTSSKYNTNVPESVINTNLKSLVIDTSAMEEDADNEHPSITPLSQLRPNALFQSEAKKPNKHTTFDGSSSDDSSSSVSSSDFSACDDEDAAEDTKGGEDKQKPSSSSSSSNSDTSSDSSSDSDSSDSSESDEEAQEMKTAPSSGKYTAISTPAQKVVMPIVHSSRGRKRTPLVPRNRKITFSSSTGP